MEKRATISGALVIVQVQYSTIGGAYPRIFIEAKPGEQYYNLDLTLPALFNMPVENWNDWNEDAVTVTAEEIAEELGLELADIEAVITEIVNK